MDTALGSMEVPFRPSGSGVPATGSEVVRDEKVIGIVTSAAYSPVLKGVLAMAALRLHGLESGATVRVSTPDGSVDAVVTDLPFITG